MLEEIQRTAEFFASWLVKKFDSKTVAEFKITLENDLISRFKNHWYPSNPLRGQAFRSILLDGVQTDPILMDIATRMGMDLVDFESCLPRHCVVFCDPFRVVCKDLQARENSYHVIYTGNNRSSTSVVVESEQSPLLKTMEQQNKESISKGVLIVSSN
ncbi:hypothetical protein FDP41_000795 [Naegleria fowleri]|uniref:Anti-proliferative protein domain-containing protein n=1 Tax=Naegleria fowleri TaxID=5763 RepID=A0A6A5CB30_NAEFO|nr:uncharacterized protein FDP41_000795 [Naegleria fowleri]KAF0984896.1 hypothetical protein FDP41_000795 [Naegleria fowleri]CAG4710812.1 unnamed protein product [Naegleria fowleri]